MQNSEHPAFCLVPISAQGDDAHGCRTAEKHSSLKTYHWVAVKKETKKNTELVRYFGETANFDVDAFKAAKS